MPDSAHQECDVGTLSPSIGVQLVKHQELQSLGVADDFLIEWILPGQDVLEHHIVGEQDVGGIILDLLPLFIAFLTCISRKSDFWSFRIAKAEIFL